MDSDHPIQINTTHTNKTGAPRVGNAAFCDDYDTRLRDVSFRVVNGLDVVAR